MIIGIDARMLGPGFGLARYVQQLVLHLERIDTTNEYVVFMRKENWDAYTPSSPRIKKVLADIAWYSVKEQLFFSSLIAKEHIDIMHFPHWNVPFLYRGPYIVTIHDLTMFHFARPEATTLGPIQFFMKDRAHRLLLRWVVRRARHIITTSDWTKYDVHNSLSVPLQKMTTIYQAPFLPSPIVDTPTVMQTYHLTVPYVLYVGAAYPHKNVERLLDAWKLYTDTYGRTHRLVLAGKPNYFYDRLVQTHPLFGDSEKVTYLGFVSDEELPALYKNASLFVFPSLYEGFGLPPLEAMMQGTPVVASHTSCLPEILGEGALYVDPISPEHIAEGIARVLHDDDVRFLLKQQGREEVKKYSWQRLAEQSLALYRAVVALEKGPRS